MRYFVPAALLLAGVAAAGLISRRQYKSLSAAKLRADEAIDLASEGSFPASDPPAWNAR